MTEIFKKVHLSDKKRIFKEVADASTLLLLKVENQDVRQVFAKKINEEKFLECEFKPGFEFDLKMSEIAVVNLSHGEDRYFFSGVISIVNSKVYLDIQGDLFYLQRRRSARMEIPEGYPAKSRIIDLNGKNLPFDFKILDFSSGGCRLALASMEPLIKTGAKFKLMITLGHRSSFESEVEVRHAKEIKTLKDLPQVLGVQFTSTDVAFESKMLNLYMDVQREIFLKYLKKT